MKICFVHEEYPEETNFGGIATYQKIMAEYYANNKDEVIVIARGKKDIEYYENNVHIFRVASLNDNNNIDSVYEYRKKVAELLKKLQDNNSIDIIETPDWGANSIFFEKDRKIPLVVRLHTPLKIWLMYNNNDFGKAKDLILKWENEMLANADLITSCSELLKKKVIENYNISKNIFVIPNPCNIKEFKLTNYTERKDLIYVGSLEERKGVIILAKAMNEVFKRIDDVKLYIIGKDTIRNSKNISTKEYILSLIDKKYHNRVIFIGQIENSKISEYLNMATLAIFPSLFDNYPYTILEAMASGNNIIASDNIGSYDIFKDNNYTFKSGSVSDLTKKILLFYESSKESINYENINNVKNKCNPTKICEEMKKLYQKAIEEYDENKR